MLHHARRVRIDPSLAWGQTPRFSQAISTALSRAWTLRGQARGRGRSTRCSRRVATEQGLMMPGQQQLEAVDTAIFSNSERRENDTLPGRNKWRAPRPPTEVSPSKNGLSRDFESPPSGRRKPGQFLSHRRAVAIRTVAYHAILCGRLSPQTLTLGDGMKPPGQEEASLWRKVHPEYYGHGDSYRLGNRRVEFFTSKNTLRWVRVRARKARLTRAVMVTPHIDLLCFILMAPKLGRFIIWTLTVSAGARPTPCGRAARTYVLRSRRRKAAGGGPERSR